MSDFDYEARIKMEALVADALRLADADNKRKAANKPVDASKQITLSIPLPSLAAMIGASGIHHSQQCACRSCRCVSD